MTKQTENTITATFHTHECGICGTPFESLTTTAKYCSDECKAEAKREANRRFYRVHGSGKADPRNQARTLVEQYLWAKTGETLAGGWKGEAGVAFSRRTAESFEKIEPMLATADAKRLMRDAEQLVIMLNVKALCAGRKLADLTTLDASEDTIRATLAATLDGLAAVMAPVEQIEEAE